MTPEAELLATTDRAEPILAHAAATLAARAPAPGKWSALQILGHLVDSAANNHQRFVRARLQDDLVFLGYDQDAWVAAGDYARADWREVVALWALLNRQLARVMTTLPPTVRSRAHTSHNLDELAFGDRAPEQPATLEWFLGDYVAHLRHHLRQIDALLGTRTG